MKFHIFNYATIVREWFEMNAGLAIELEMGVGSGVLGSVRRAASMQNEGRTLKKN